MSHYHGYQGAGPCTGTATPGAKALMAWFLGAYGGRGGTNLGIYNCADIPGSSVPSLHGEGRAADLGIPVGASWGQGLADWLVEHSAELGIQCVIYRQHIWSGSYPDAGWRPYNGSNPHVEHAHVELSWNSARTLTVERINAVVRGEPVPSAPAPPPGQNWTERLIMQLADIAKGGGGQLVRNAQGLLLAHGEYLGRWGIDGDFGPATDNAVRMFQRSHGLTDDGIIGPKTWTALLG